MNDVTSDPVMPIGPGSLADAAGLVLRPLHVADLDEVCELEQRAYSFPWTRGNFIDSLHAGYPAWLLQAPAAGTWRSLGYYLAMPGVDEMHLLNITVAPAMQGHGLGRQLLAHLAAAAWAAKSQALWLEVREANARARRLYEHTGFETVGRRKGYYPAAHGQREDAIVMRLMLPAAGALATAPDWRIVTDTWPLPEGSA